MKNNEIRIPVHSIIDVITNSSTEIYTYAKDSAKEFAYEALNEILKIAGSDKKAEDLFDVSIVTEESSWRDEPESEIIIKAKNSSVSNMNIFQAFFNCIYQDAEYNG